MKRNTLESNADASKADAGTINGATLSEAAESDQTPNLGHALHADIDAAIDAGKRLKEAHAQLTKRKAELTEERESVQQMKVAIYRLPLMADEALEVIYKFIDRRASRFTEQAKWATIFANFANPKGVRPDPTEDFNPLARPSRNTGPLNLRDLDGMKTGQSAGMFGDERLTDLVNGPEGSAVSDQDRFCFFFGDALKDKVRKHFDSHFPDNALLKNGLSIAQKRESIEDLDHKLDSIAAEIGQIDTKLAQIEDAGVQKPLVHRYN